MTALGELLELIHGARRSLGSVQGTLREWRDESLVGRLETDHWSIYVDEAQHRSAEGEFEQLTDFKLALPDRVRVETRIPGDRPNSIVVCDAFWLLGFLEFDTPRRATRAGRQVLVARGHPRYPLPWPFGPADEHELVVDPTRGTLIRMAGLWRGNEAFVHELVELEHDVTFDEESFALAAAGVVTGLGLREAASLAGFQLWALPRPVLDVTYRPEPVESVTLTYDDATLLLTPASARQAFVSFGELEQVERGDRSYWLTPGQVGFAEDDTSIRLWHPTATGAELIDYAESLVALP